MERVDNGRRVLRDTRWSLLAIGFPGAYAVGVVGAWMLKALGWWSDGGAWERAWLICAQGTVSPILDWFLLSRAQLAFSAS